MDRQSNCNRPSPLRNSKAVNRPFQSPLRSVLSPGGRTDLDNNRFRKSNVRSSPYSRNLTTPKKTIATTSRPKLLAKRICQESSSSSKQTKAKKDDEECIDEAGLKKIRDRIFAKKREIEYMKQQSLYKKKHASRDLHNLIERWLRGCQEALMQFQKDISEHSGSAVDITEILAQLGISPEVVKYSVEDCDFT